MEPLVIERINVCSIQLKTVSLFETTLITLPLIQTLSPLSLLSALPFLTFIHCTKLTISQVLLYSPL